jgi:hypothetical protein
MSDLNFENAEGAETRTKKLQILSDKHNDSGMLCMVSSGGSMDLTTAYQIIDAGGVISIDEKKNLFDYNSSTKQMMIYEDGYYSIRVNGSMEIPANAEVSITLYKNGTQYNPFADVIINGLGTNKPLTATLIMSLKLKENDVLDIRAKADTSTTVTFLGNNSTFEKKIF